MAKSFNPDTGGTLNTGLSAYYRMDETSGTRADETGNGSTLTEVGGTVNSGTGIQTKAASFGGTNIKLSINDNAYLSYPGTSFSVAFWVYLNNKTSYRFILGKWDSEGQYEYTFYYFPSGATPSDRLMFSMCSNGASSSQVTIPADTYGSPSTGVWIFIAGGYDASAGKIWINVNNGGENNINFAGPKDGSSTFKIGTDGGNHLNGLVDEVGWWTKKLSATELADLYNSGSGNTYKEWPAVSSRKIRGMGITR